MDKRSPGKNLWLMRSVIALIACGLILVGARALFRPQHSEESQDVHPAHLVQNTDRLARLHVPPPAITPLASGLWLRIRKADRRLYQYRNGQIVHEFPISLGFAPIGAKEHRDDYKTPEGVYYLCGRNPHSQFYCALRLSYPNVQDAERCASQGLITSWELAAVRRAIKHQHVPPQNTKAGGDIMIHGGGTGRDWTWGCIALDNQNMKVLYAALPAGTPVLIEK